MRHGFLGCDEGGHTSNLLTGSCDIFAPVGMEVCDGAHRLVVMKEVRRGLQEWERRGNHRERDSTLR